MEFRIADTFTDSLAKLTIQDQKVVKTTSFDLQMNPASPGLQFHRVDKSKDPNFWSIRANRDIRLIIHKTAASMMLCYVGHHDDAYDWAIKRKLETHPKTGAAQLVEVRTRVEIQTIPVYEVADATQINQPLFENYADDELLGYGVPTDWLSDVRSVNSEDTLLELTEHLPSEASEALLDLATGSVPQPPVEVTVTDGTDPFAHPDAQRRFRVMSNIEELQRALDYPWEKWSVFLHPSQRELVEKEYNGPARVSGSAGTGKTIVALHRAVYLLKTDSEARVWLTTFSQTLASSLQLKLKRLISNEPRLGERIEVRSMDNMALRLYKRNFGSVEIVSDQALLEIIATAAENFDENKFSNYFLLKEWNEVVDAWQLESWDSYRSVKRLGRKTRLAENQRKMMWEIFKIVRSELSKRNLLTMPDIYLKLSEKFQQNIHPIFDSVVVDEAQDISIPQLRFLSVLGDNRENALFFAGDLGQRIFQQPFSWKSLGVDIRGRSKTLRINYRTSHQIRKQADLLLEGTIKDVDGNVEDRSNTISIFNSDNPKIKIFDSEQEEIFYIRTYLSDLVNHKDLKLHEIGVFVRSFNELPRAELALFEAGLDYKLLDNQIQPTNGYVSVSTMHLAKGLEFRAVVVMACDDEVIPLQERIESIIDEADLEEVYNTERHLLYVACTRARDHLLVTSTDPASEFLDDLRM